MSTSPDTGPGALDYHNQERRRMAVDIARLQEQVKVLGRDMIELKETNRQQNVKLDEVLEKLAEAKGGWHTLLWLGGAGATVGAGVSWILTHIKVMP